MAGLKEGDKITKINGKTTLGMSYEQFCYEIVVAQQQQQKNNMIHLMVMRRSTKVNVHSSTTASSISNLSGPTVLPIKNNYEQKTTKTSILSTSTSSNLADEGYVPGSATSATSSATTTTANVSSTNIPNTLVSVVKVTSTSPTGKTNLPITLHFLLLYLFLLTLNNFPVCVLLEVVFCFCLLNVNY